MSLSQSELWGQPPNWEPRTPTQRARDNAMCGYCGHPRQRHVAGACNYMAGFQHPCQCQQFVEAEDA